MQWGTPVFIMTEYIYGQEAFFSFFISIFFLDISWVLTNPLSHRFPKTMLCFRKATTEGICEDPRNKKKERMIEERKQSLLSICILSI